MLAEGREAEGREAEGRKQRTEDREQNRARAVLDRGQMAENREQNRAMAAVGNATSVASILAFIMTKIYFSADEEIEIAFPDGIFFW